MSHNIIVVMLSQVPRNDEGLEAIIFTAQGDMRQALNNLQSTYAGFGFVSAENVFKVRGLSDIGLNTNSTFLLLLLFY